jgi:two-component system, chemotaxis family, CheB/CheR fusion protein
VVFNGVRAGGDDQVYRITCRVVPAAPQRHGTSSSPSSANAGRATRRSAAIQIDLDQVSQQQLAALEAELGTTKESLQAAIEQLEASNEELQASNEELQASNEELQSTNEELQSVNEELYTVNAEYQRKIAELTELTNDMDNLLASTDVGTIFLDGQLRIRKFTPQVTDTFGLLPQDVGPLHRHLRAQDAPPRSWSRISGACWLWASRSSATCPTGGQDVLPAAPALSRQGRHRRRRADPDRRQRAEGGGRRALPRALSPQQPPRSVPDAIYFKDARGRFIRFNHAMAARLGLGTRRRRSARRRSTCRSTKPRWRCTARTKPCSDRASPSTTGWSGARGRWRRGLGHGDPAAADRSRARDRRRDAIFRDVTEQVRAKAKIDEEVRRRDQFLAMLSHELRNPLGRRRDGDGDAEVARRAERRAGAHGGDPGAAVAPDGAAARRSAGSEPGHAEQDRAAPAGGRPAPDRRRGRRGGALPGRRRRAAAQVELDEHPLCVFGDPARLQQIQINLLNNAVKYTPPGGAVSVRVGRDDTSAVVRVSDTGDGIPPRHARLGVRPVRAGQAYARARGGRPGRGADPGAGARRDARRHVSARSDGDGPAASSRCGCR